MRELKFRAWDKEWCKMLLPGEWAMPRIQLDGSLYDDFGDCLYTDNYIIEQYTGLKDKNGKEIYVGDILETCCGKAEVYFDDELLMYRIKVRHGGTMPLVSKKSKRHFDYEVIGNIHENPELLEGEK